jgi:hypothetical protein
MRGGQPPISTKEAEFADFMYVSSMIYESLVKEQVGKPTPDEPRGKFLRKRLSKIFRVKRLPKPIRQRPPEARPEPNTSPPDLNTSNPLDLDTPDPPHLMFSKIFVPTQSNTPIKRDKFYVISVLRAPGRSSMPNCITSFRIWAKLFN